MASLEHLPVELVEEIVSILELHDTCELRLVSRLLSAKASQGSFKSRFIHAKVDTTSDEALRRFVAVVRHEGSMGGLIRYLVLTANPRCIPNEDQIAQSRELLIEGLTNLQLHLRRASLESLALHVENTGWHVVSNEATTTTTTTTTFRRAPSRLLLSSVWSTSIRLSRLASDAISGSRIVVDRLDLFGSVGRCSLACDHIRPMLSRLHFPRHLSHLTSLSLSLSRHSDRDMSLYCPAQPGFECVRDMAYLLNCCTSLEHLELHWFFVPSRQTLSDRDEADEGAVLFQHALVPAALHRLQSCTLKGLEGSAEAVLAFLSLHRRLHRLAFEFFSLQSGEWRPIFDYIARDMTNLRALHFKDLWESNFIVFDAPLTPPPSPISSPSAWTPPASPPTVDPDPRSTTVLGKGIRLPLQYHVVADLPVCDATEVWMQQMLLDYGAIIVRNEP